MLCEPSLSFEKLCGIAGVIPQSLTKKGTQRAAKIQQSLLKLIVSDYLVVFSFAVGLQAQQELTLHFSKTLQAQATNPAFFPDKQVIITLPAIAYGYGNNAFAYDDIFLKNSNFDSTSLNIEGLINQLEPENILQTQLNVDLLRIQLRFKSWYISFLASEKLDVKFAYRKELLELAWYGNAPFVGTQLELGPALHATYYRELSMGLGFKKEKWQAGIRLKLLAGLANIDAAKSHIGLFTEPTTYALQIDTDYELRTSQIDQFLSDPLSAAMSFDNLGMGIDAGILLRPTKTWTIQASVVNTGFIRWEQGIRNFTSQGEFEFKGVSLNDYFNNDSLYTQTLIDSLEKTFFPKENQMEYTSRLVPRIYLSAKWKANKRLELGGLLYSEWIKGYRPALMLYGGYKVFSFWEIGGSYLVKNDNLANVGVQTRFDLGPLQIFAVTDHLLSLVQLRKARNLNWRMGISLQFGKPLNR